MGNVVFKQKGKPTLDSDLKFLKRKILGLVNKSVKIIKKEI